MTEHSGCPHLDGFDPLIQEQVADPAEFMAKARKEVPVFFLPDYNVWVVTRYEDVATVMADTKTFSSANMLRPPAVPEEFQSRLPAGYPMTAAQIIQMDPPEHTPLRRVAQRGYTPKVVAARESELRVLAAKLLDDIFVNGEADIAQEYCYRIPIYMAAAMLGVDLGMVDQLRQWTKDSDDLMTEGKSPDGVEAVNTRMVEYDVFVRDLIADRRASPREDDLVTELVVHGEEEEAFDDDVLLGVVTNLLTGGTGTTGSTMTGTLHRMLRDRTQWEMLVEDPELTEKAVEEGLRLANQIRGMIRVTTCDTEIAGVSIPAGSAIQVHQYSANRDEAAYEDGETFDLRRANSKHFGLGRGAHFCLGAVLARLELRVGLETLVERIPDLALAAEPSPDDWTPSMYFSHLNHLAVTWSPDRAAVLAE